MTSKLEGFKQANGSLCKPTSYVLLSRYNLSKGFKVLVYDSLTIHQCSFIIDRINA